MKHTVLIAGTGSNCGKTTTTIAVMAALKARGIGVSAFKCGPDYIDPMFHKQVMGLPSHNLDLFFMGEDALPAHFAKYVGEFNIVEGVMGYYDGVGKGGKFSTHDVAVTLDVPVILVINARGMAASAGAIMQGFKNYMENSKISGVIFNQISPKTYPMLRELAISCGLKPLGFFPRVEDIEIKSRPLGLLPPAEVERFEEKLEQMRKIAEEHIDLDGIIELGGGLCKDCAEKAKRGREAKKDVRIAVTRDEAFCFMYSENVEELEANGADIQWFSPIHDKHLPEDVNAIYICGGFPEPRLEELSSNHTMMADIKKAVESGMPLIAECGGYMYLHDTIKDYKLVGLIHAHSFKTPELQRFGYTTVTANQDNLLCKAGVSIRGHEFHYFDSTDLGNGFTAQRLSTGEIYQTVHANSRFWAGFPHIYFPSQPELAASFMNAAREYKAERGKS